MNPFIHPSPVDVCIYAHACLCVYLFICLHLPIYLRIKLSFTLAMYLPLIISDKPKDVHVSIHTRVYISLFNIYIYTHICLKIKRARHSVRSFCRQCEQFQGVSACSLQKTKPSRWPSAVLEFRGYIFYVKMVQSFCSFSAW